MNLKILVDKKTITYTDKRDNNETLYFDLEKQ